MPDTPTEEIIVTGTRFPVSPRGPIRGLSAPLEGPGREPSVTKDNLGTLAFVAPALVPQVEEIIVTASRPAPSPARVATPRAAGGLLPTLFAVVGGVLIAEILDELGEQKLDAAMRRLDEATGRVKPDTPLIVEPAPDPTPQVDPIPEIIVTGRRRVSLAPILGGIIALPGVPTKPPRRPRRRPPITPRPPGRPRRPGRRPGTPPQRRPGRVPRTPTIPSAPPATVPPTRPSTIPTTSPARIPTTIPGADLAPSPGAQIQFATAPSFFPGAVPAGSPFTFPRLTGPQAFAGVPLTGVGSVVLPFGSTSPSAAEALAQDPSQRRCKPCKKEKEERRRRCFKKLVEERAFERWDNVFEWAELDCETGVEL